MVKHIVMFKLNEKTSENQETLVKALKGLEGPIESLKYLEVGEDFKQSARSYDVVLTTQFEDKAGLEAYAKHPHHQPVLQLARDLCSSTVVVDYEL